MAFARSAQVSAKRALATLSSVCFAVFFSLALCLPAKTQSWPTKPVKIVIPYPAGGGVDTLGREIASGLQASLGQDRKSVV